MRTLIALVLAALTAGTASSQALGAPGADPGLPDGAHPDVRPAAVVLLASSLDVGGMHVVLQSTSLSEVQARLGGSVSRQGDAGVGVRSLCYYQPHTRIPWALWLQSSELYQGDVIHGYRWARLAAVNTAGAAPEAGCVALRQRADAPLGTMLKLGEPRDEVVAVLGPPVTETPGTLLFIRAGLTVIEGTLFTLQNRAFIKLQDRQVDSVEVWKTTSIAQ